MILTFLILTLTAMGGISEQDYQIEQNESDGDSCGNNDWCSYYNQQAESACIAYYASMESRADTQCYGFSWQDGPCETDYNGCEQLAYPGECNFTCYAADNNDDQTPWYTHGYGNWIYNNYYY